MKTIKQNIKIEDILLWGALFVSIIISMVVLLFVKAVSDIACLLFSIVLLLVLFIQSYVYIHWKSPIGPARFTMALSCIMAVVFNRFGLWIPQVLLLCAFIMVYTESVQEKKFFSVLLSGAFVFEVFSILNLCKIIAVHGMMGVMIRSYITDIVFVILFLMVAFYENKGSVSDKWSKIAGIAAAALSTAVILIFFVGACGITEKKLDARQTEEIKKGDWIMFEKTGDSQIVLKNSDSYLVRKEFEYSKQNIFHLVKAGSEGRWYIKDFMGRVFDIQEEEIAAGQSVRLLSFKKDALSWKIIDVVGMGTVFEAAENMYLNVERDQNACLFPWDGAGNNLFEVKIFRSRLEHIMYFLRLDCGKIEITGILLCSIAAVLYGIAGNIRRRNSERIEGD